MRGIREEILAAQPPQPLLVLQLPQLEAARGSPSCSSAKRAWRSSAAAARSSGRSRGSCTDSAAAMTSTCARQPSSRAASSMRATRGSSGRRASSRPTVGQLAAVVDRAQLGEQLVAVGDRARARRVEERKLLDLAQAQALHAQDHRGERGAQQLRVGEGRALGEVLLRIEPDADAVGDAPAAPGALLRRGLRDRLDVQHLDLVAVAVALDAREAGVDHVADARHGERGLGDVGREHDAALLAGLEHAVLLGRRQPRSRAAGSRSWRSPAAAESPAASRISRSPGRNTSTSPGPFAAQLVDRVGERLLLLVARGVLRVAAHRPVAHLHRVEPARDLDHRRVVEMPRETLGVDGGRGDDHLQVGTCAAQLLEVAQQEIDVEAALVRLVDDDAVVLAQLAVALRLGEQDAVGHQLDRGALAHLLVEAHLVADAVAELGAQLLGDARGDRARGDAPRLGVADAAARACRAHLEQDLGQLRGLARAGLAADDDDRVRVDRRADLVAPRVDRQRGVEMHSLAGDQRHAVVRQGDRHLGAGGHRARHVAVDDEQRAHRRLHRVFHMRAEIRRFADGPAQPG